MLKAYKEFWINYINFEGRTTRKNYWFAQFLHTFVLCILIVPFIVLLFKVWSYAFYLGPRPSHQFLLWGMGSWGISFLYMLAGVIPTYAIAVRRLRDAGIHWGFIFLCALPYVGTIILLGYTVLPSKKD